MEVMATGTWCTCWTDDPLLLIKIPEDGSLVPKHVAVCT